jgi:hypothetical protein
MPGAETKAGIHDKVSDAGAVAAKQLLGKRTHRDRRTKYLLVLRILPDSTPYSRKKICLPQKIVEHDRKESCLSARCSGTRNYEGTTTTREYIVTANME